MGGILEIGSKTKENCAREREYVRYDVHKWATSRLSAQYERRIGRGQLKHGGEFAGETVALLFDVRDCCLKLRVFVL